MQTARQLPRHVNTAADPIIPVALVRALFAIDASTDIMNFMISHVTQRAAEAVPIAVRESLGNRLGALYLYGSLAEGRYLPQQSDINLLVVVEASVTLREVRNVLRPLWLGEFRDLRISPLVASSPILARHLQLNPVLASHLAEQAQLLAGVEMLPTSGPVSGVERLARIAYETMLASSALGHTLLSAHAAEKSLFDLRRLARMHSAALGRDDMTAVALMASVQSELSREMLLLDLPQYRERSIPRKPLIIPELQAIYETEDRIVLVLPDLSPERISEVITVTNWVEVARRITGKYEALRVTTAGQLRLILEYETAADYHLHNYVHAWGRDTIGGMSIPDWRVFRQLARLPSELQLATLPQAYIVADEPSLSMLIHDLQNMLLNIQLRSELIGRITGRKLQAPPMALPDRNTPNHDRIAGIWKHLDWWSGYHTSIMERLLADSS